MRILHITKKYPHIIGGDATTVFNLEKQQKSRNYQVFIATSNSQFIVDKKNIFKVGVRVAPSELDKISFKRIISLVVLLFFGLKNLMKIRPNIIYSHSADMGFIISLSARLYKIPTIQICHGVSFPYSEYAFLKRFLEKFCLKYGNFEKIITVDKRSVKNFKKIGIKNIIYTPFGVDLERFNKINSRKSSRTFNFLFVGRLEKQKGIEYLIKACTILKKSEKNFKVLIVGNGSQREILENLTKSLGLTNHISFLNEIHDEKLVRIYKESNYFILPSIWEGFPLTLLEAWASGLAVIATNVGGISDICVDKENALIVPSKNPKGLADAMTTLIKNKKLREKLSRNGKKLVEQEYSWDKISKKIEEIYESNIRGKV